MGYIFGYIHGCTHGYMHGYIGGCIHGCIRVLAQGLRTKSGCLLAGLDLDFPVGQPRGYYYDAQSMPIHGTR